MASINQILLTSPGYTLVQLLFTFGLFASNVLSGIPAAVATLKHVSPVCKTWVTLQSWPLIPRHIIYNDEYYFSNIKMPYFSDVQIIAGGVNDTAVDCRQLVSVACVR
jgi:hypothetical protein